MLAAVLSRVMVALCGLVAARVAAPYDFWMRGNSRSGPLSNWDGVHLLGIARDGYTSEQSHAFFPLFPFLVRHLRCVGVAVWLDEVALPWFPGLCVDEALWQPYHPRRCITSGVGSTRRATVP